MQLHRGGLRAPPGNVRGRPTQGPVIPSPPDPSIQVTVNSEAVSLPVSAGPVRVTFEGQNLILQTTKGLRILYDGNFHVLISIPSSFHERVCGLCGNFNGNWSDDFVLPTGLVASTVEAFAAAWRDFDSSQEDCSEGCGSQGCPVCLAEETKAYEDKKACGLLQDPQGPFATCHEVLKPSEYFRQCVYDMCAHKGDEAFLCHNLAAYTAACQAAGSSVEPWRSDSFCSECPRALQRMPGLFLLCLWLYDSAPPAPSTAASAVSLLPLSLCLLRPLSGPLSSNFSFTLSLAFYPALSVVATEKGLGRSQVHTKA